MFYDDWRAWLILVALIVVGYVQSVGKQIEMLSGYQRMANLRLYRILFGSAYPIFRFSGLLQTGLVVATFAIFGWKIGLSAIAAVFLYPFTLWRVSRKHATIMLQHLDELSETQI